MDAGPALCAAVVSPMRISPLEFQYLVGARGMIDPACQCVGICFEARPPLIYTYADVFYPVVGSDWSHLIASRFNKRHVAALELEALYCAAPGEAKREPSSVPWGVLRAHLRDRGESSEVTIILGESAITTRVHLTAPGEAVVGLQLDARGRVALVQVRNWAPEDEPAPRPLTHQTRESVLRARLLNSLATEHSRSLEDLYHECAYEKGEFALFPLDPTFYLDEVVAELLALRNEELLRVEPSREHPPELGLIGFEYWLTPKGHAVWEQGIRDTPIEHMYRVPRTQDRTRRASLD